MKILSWNCRGLGEPATVSQLQESIRLHLPDMVFLCETKEAVKYVSSVCRKLNFGERWAVCEPRGKKGGMLIALKEGVEVKQIKKSEFCMEVQVENVDEGENFWAIFVHASTEASEEKDQWEILKSKKQSWGANWVMEGGLQ